MGQLLEDAPARSRAVSHSGRGMFLSACAPGVMLRSGLAWNQLFCDIIFWEKS